MDRQNSTDSISTALGRESDSQQTVGAGSASGVQYRDHQQPQQQRLPNGSSDMGQQANRDGARDNGGFYSDGGHVGGRGGRGGDGHGHDHGRGGNSGGNGRDGDYGDSDAEAASEVEDLPQINVQMIPLSVIVGRLITFAYTELVTLVDTLPSRAEGERRSEILKYTEHMSDLLTKLLVLVRWAKNAPQIQKCQNVIAYLDTQNRFFECSVDSIYATYLLMPNVRMRNYDVSNAVDILTTGSYQRLPTAIKRMVPPPKLTKRQIRETLEAIDGIIRNRLLRGEPVPQAMRQYRIANGRITFTVPKEFEATLTLLQFESDIPWHVVDVKVLVSGDKTLPEEQHIVINTWQIVDRAQHLLIESSAATAGQEPDQEQPATATSEAISATLEQDDGAKGTLVQSSSPLSSAVVRPPQLAQLYDFLHRQCLVVLLETIVKQATVLRRTRWENLLQVEMSADRTMLMLRYWTSSRAASASRAVSHDPSVASQAASSDTVGAPAALRGNTIVFRLCPLPVPRPIHASAIEGPDALEATPRDDDSAERGEFFRIEQDRRNLIPKIGLNVTWSAQAGLAAPKVWSRTVTQASELQVGCALSGDAVGDFDLTLDPEEVNTERLLRQVTWRHARSILESLHASVLASGLFSQDAVQLLYVTTLETAKSESELTSDEINMGTATPKLRAWYRQDEGAVDITVDAFTGRLVVRASEVVATSTSLSEAMIGQLADQLNRSPWRLAELLVDMRSSLALVDLDSLASRSLGLRPQNSQGAKAPALPGFVLSSVQKRLESANGPQSHSTAHVQHLASLGASGVSGPRVGSGMPGTTPHLAQMGMVSPGSQPISAATAALAGFQQPSVMASNFPLRVSQQEADALMREVAGVDNPLGRIRFYKVEGTEGVEEQLETTFAHSAAGISNNNSSNSSNASATSAAKGEWYIMVAMTDRLRFRLVLLNPHPADRLMFVVAQVISLQVDRLFSSVARRLLAERRLDTSIFARSIAPSVSGAKRGREDSVSSARGAAHKDAAEADDLCGSTNSKRNSDSEREITEKVDAMLTGRTSITLDYLNALASTCRARLALRLLQTQLTRWKIPYSFRLPSFSTSPHGHRAAVSKELSVVGLDKMGLYELDEQVPTLYIPVFALMRASPINWSVVNMGVLPDESRRMVSIRIASDELDPSMRADLSSSTRVDQHRQAALAKSAGNSVPFAGALHSRYAPGGSQASGIISDISGASSLQHGTKQSLIGRHVIPCQVIASIPLALDGLPTPIAQAYADAVYFGAHAAADGGYHRKESESHNASSNPRSSSSSSGEDDEGKIRGGYSKMVLVYKQVNRALQCLIRDWSEHHLMTHIGRYMYSWERRSLRRVLASTMAFYPFNAGPYTGAVASTLGSWRGHQSTEIVIQCLGSCYLSISCRVPYPFASDDKDKSMYPPDYEDSGGSDLTYHLTLADIDSKTRQIRRVASTWPWVFAHNSRSHQDAAERGFTVNSNNGMHGKEQSPGGGVSENGRSGSRGASFEVSTSMSRWLRTLQARLNLTGNPISVLMMIVQLMPINHMLSAMCPQDHLHSMSPLTSSESRESLLRMQFKDLVGDEIKEDASEDVPQLPEDVVSHQILNKLSSMSHGLGNAFDSVRGLNVMYMYTAADNIRIVFNSRYVVDLRLVASDLFHVRDVVGTAHLFSKQPRASLRQGSALAPEPLITSAAEPIPLFDSWLDAVSRGMRFDWARYEKGMSIAASEMTASASGTAESSSDAQSQSDLRQRIRMFQRNLFRLHPNAPKAEQMMFKFRELFHRQNSAKSPTLVPLPPSGFLCSRLHLVSILRSLMQWLVKSVHLRDQLESAILRTQETIEATGNECDVAGKDGSTGALSAATGGAARGTVGRVKDSLFSIKEKLVVKDEAMDGRANTADSGAENRQVMIVGFTGARESVRCEFLMRAGVTNAAAAAKAVDAEANVSDGGSDQARDEKKGQQRAGSSKSASKDAEADAEAEVGMRDEPSFMSHMFDLFEIPADLMDVDLDVRIVPMNRPPNGITDAAAGFLVNAFKSQKANNRQRAGSLVRILALPPQLVMDVVDIGRKLDGKVSLCLLRDGFEYDLRLDSSGSTIAFSIKFRNKENKWLRLFIQYALLSGTAKVVWAIDPNIVDFSDTGNTEKWTRRPDAMLEVWNKLLDDVVAAMDNETAFTRDMGKSGKSRLYDIISRLYEAQLASPLVSGGRDEVSSAASG